MSTKYEIIYADPPWPYNSRCTHSKTRFGGGVHGQYQVMSELDILAIGQYLLPLCAKNSVLFMWATMPRLPLAIQAINAWGFRYATNGFTWIKTNPKAGTPFTGPGFYTASNAELCLIGVRGKVAPIRKLVSSIVIEPRREHSRKPDVVRERIVEVFGDRPRLELFCRFPAPGWDAVGNGVTGRDIRDDLIALAAEEASA